MVQLSNKIVQHVLQAIGIQREQDLVICILEGRQVVADEFDPFECEAVGPANECKSNSEEAWRCWGALSHTAVQLTLGSIVAANRNQRPSIEVQAKYTTNHVWQEEKASTRPRVVRFSASNAPL